MIKKISQTVRKIHASKGELLIQIFFVFIVPVLLLERNIIPINTRIPILIGMVTLFVLFLVYEKWTLAMLHLERKNLKKYMLPYLLFTIVGVIVISTFGEQTGHEEMAKWWLNNHLLYLFLIVSAFQEIAYRGYLIPALQKIVGSPVLVLFFNALIFTYMHAIFPNPQINLPLAFVGGLGFAAIYMKYPNLFLIILSHSVLNFCAILFGFFTIQ
jgi:membrane protease YdiL (CAAX protease family)